MTTPTSMSEIPRVLHVVISLGAGGLERLVVEWTHARNAQSPDSTYVICLDELGALGPQVCDGAVRCVAARRERFPWDSDAVALMVEAVGECGREAPVVLHSHNLAAQQYAGLVARRCGVGHVHTQHGLNPHHWGLIDRLRSWCVGRYTDRIVAVSDAVARSMTDRQGIAASRIVAIPNGVSPHVAAPPEELRGLRERLVLPVGIPTLGSMGRLDGVKGHDRLIRAFAAMVQAGGGSPARLLLVGDGPMRGVLEEQARALGIQEQVRFAGFLPLPRPCLELMDVFVLPSRSEGLPLALLEALAAGVPAVATAVGECAVVLGHGERGMVLPEDEAGWPGMLRAALEEARSGRAGPRAARAREWVAGHFSLQSSVEAYEKEYRAVARRSRCL